MSLKAKGLWKNPSDYIMKWDVDRLWYTCLDTNVFHELWTLRNTYSGWDGEDELEGAALVAPLPILYWE